MKEIVVKLKEISESFVIFFTNIGPNIAKKYLIPPDRLHIT